LTPFSPEFFLFTSAAKNVGVRRHRTVLLSVVSCGYEHLSLTLDEEHRMRVFENRVLRRLFGSKRDEVT
jgi:hypothetical protein